MRAKAARSPPEGWTLRLLELTSGPAPPNWQEVDWRYPEYLFFASKIDGQIAAEWLRNGSIPLREISIPASFRPDLYRERRESEWQSNSAERRASTQSRAPSHVRTSN